MAIVFCHGLESDPHGRKYHALCDAGLDVTSPDFRGKNLAARVALLVRVVRGRRPTVVVGSSYGGATAVCAAMQTPVRALVLCAPALGLSESPLDALAWRDGPSTTIIHGTRDDVCPIEHSRTFATHANVHLIEVDDDHRLTDSLGVIVREVTALCE